MACDRRYEYAISQQKQIFRYSFEENWLRVVYEVRTFIPCMQRPLEYSLSFILRLPGGEITQPVCLWLVNSC